MPIWRINNKAERDCHSHFSSINSFEVTWRYGILDTANREKVECEKWNKSVVSSHRDKCFVDEHCGSVNELNFSIQRIHSRPVLLINVLITFQSSLFTRCQKNYTQDVYLKLQQRIFKEQ